MNPAMVKGLVIGAVVATAGGAIAGYSSLSTESAQTAVLPPSYAEVVAVAEATEQVAVPRQECTQVPVTVAAPARDKHQVAGTVTGAVIGGVLGNQIGGGSGKKIATVAGAAAGGYAGNKIQERVQANDTVTTMETRCETVTDYSSKVVGYDVTYRIGEEEGYLRMAERPGERIPLEDGQLVLN